MNTNYNQNVAGALKLLTVNGQTYQIGKDASSSVGGIMKLFGGSGAFESYKAATDGAYDAKTIYDEIHAINEAIGADGGEGSISGRVGDIEDALGSGFDESNTVADEISGLKTRMTSAEGDIDDLQSDVNVLKGNSSTAGSVAYQIAQIVNENQNGSIDTLNEIAAWIINDSTGAAKMAADITALQTAVGNSSMSDKADKVSNATSGNFAGLDANGNLTDSGKKASDFVAAESGKRLMTDAEGTKLGNIAAGAEVNVIEGVKINGTAGSITNKIADLGDNYVQDASYVHTDNNYTTAEKNKLAAISASVSTDTLVITTAAA